jgi:hypothetical protein
VRIAAPHAWEIVLAVLLFAFLAFLVWLAR